MFDTLVLWNTVIHSALSMQLLGIFLCLCYNIIVVLHCFFNQILSLLAIIIIGASPYWRALFVLEAITWPFHIVMLITSLVFISTLIMYSLFLSGQHLEYPQVAWPTLVSLLLLNNVKIHIFCMKLQTFALQ